MDERAVDYLKSRGIVDPTVLEFVGPRFSNGRVILPWKNRDVEIYKSGRAVNGQKPRYLNQSGERPPLFAGPGAGESERVALVDGILDAIVCSQAGTPGFATANSSLSDAGVSILADKKQVILVPDRDQAGDRWLHEAIEKLAGKVELLVAVLPEGVKDVAELAQGSEDPVEVVARLLDSAVPPNLQRIETPVVGSLPGEKPNLQPLGTPVVGLVRSYKEIGGDDLIRADTPKLESLPFFGADGYLIRGFSTLFVAYPKVGKTETTAALIPGWVEAGDTVLYFTEEPQLIWQARLNSSSTNIWQNVHFVFSLGADPKELLDRVSSGSETVVVVDTLRSCLQFSNEVDNSEVAATVNPWIAAAREDGKTFIALHHAVKSGGEDGRGIAGGHSLFGAFDAALELSKAQGGETRRKAKVFGRLISPPEVLFERDESGAFYLLGNPQLVELEEVVERVRELMGDEWMHKRSIHDSLDEPRPNHETLRQALAILVEQGDLIRDPAENRKGASYRWRKSKPTTGVSIGCRLGPGEEEAVQNVLQVFPGSLVDEQIPKSISPDLDPQGWLRHQWRAFEKDKEES